MPLLYIDDSLEDRFLLREAVRRTKTRFTLYTADGPESAAPHFEFHRLNDKFNPYPRPALVLLDYNMGLRTGADFLFWLRVQKQMTAVPVVMYSNCNGDARVAECYEMGATLFLRKPETLSGIETMIRTLRLCMQFRPPQFRPLSHLPEYEAAPPLPAAEVA